MNFNAERTANRSGKLQFLLSLIQRLFWRQADVPAQSNGPLMAEVESALTEVQAYARSHGGSIEVVSVTDDGVLSIRMAGACKGCPVSYFTIRYGVEERLRTLVPGIKKIVQVHD